MTKVNTASKSTDWDKYYRESPAPSKFTRPIIQRTFIRALSQYSIANPVLAELGGGGSRVLDAVIQAVRPSEYHIIDNNRVGMDLLLARVQKDKLVLHVGSVLDLDMNLQVDTVFSLGLIEHFDEGGTRQAVLAHFRILKPGGIAVITFPTPTYLYRMTRGVAELSGKWIFHDERPLWTKEVARSLEGIGTILHEEIIWPIGLTQTLLVIRKK
jgi:SAM-dependent methyltransferase